MSTPWKSSPRCDSVTQACRDVAAKQISTLFPTGVLPPTEEALQRTISENWVADQLLQKESAKDQHELIEDCRSTPVLLSKRRSIVLHHFDQMHSQVSVADSQDIVQRAAGNGWALRLLMAKEKKALIEAQRSNAEFDELATLITETTRMPADGHGDWYECNVASDIGPSELLRMTEFAKKHVDDCKAQVTLCRIMAKAASAPKHMNASYLYHARIGVVLREGVASVVEAMCTHGLSKQIQLQGCQAIWQITESSKGATAAENAGSVEVVCSAMLRFPQEKPLQLAACAALANISKQPRRLVSFEETRDAVANAMSNFPRDMNIQGHACTIIWQLARDDPGVISRQLGLHTLLRNAMDMGIKESRLLLTCLQWQSPSSDHTSRGGGRQRWGQWATGRLGAA